MSILNTIVAKFRNTATTEPTSSPVNFFIWQAVAVNVYGEVDGRTTKMQIGLDVEAFRQWHSVSTFPTAQSAADEARSFSRQGWQYAVTKSGKIVAIYLNGVQIKTSEEMGSIW